MNEITLALILGILVVLTIGVLLLRTGIGTWKVSVGELFKSELKLGADTQQAVEESVHRAMAARNLEPTIDAASTPTVYPKNIPVRRILWVDDNPDNNVFESIALEQLGLAVSKATSSTTAFMYLDKHSYAVIISDLNRPDDPLDGLGFVRKTRQRYPRSSLLIYTLSPSITAAEATEAGAAAMATTPRDLLNAVLTVLR